MTFPMGNERFAIETQYVREVIRVGDITPLPGAPEFVEGLTNLRGEVLAVMDLRKLFNIASPADRQAELVVLGTDRPDFGFLADDVDEVITIRVLEVLDPPGSVSGRCLKYLHGVTASAILVLNGDALLSDDQLIIDEAE